MARPKTGSTAVVVRLHVDIAEALRAVVKRDSLNQSVFVQNAVVRALRNYRSPMEFIAENREKKDREGLPGALNGKLDWPDGRPKQSKWYTEANWMILWKSVRDPRSDIDKMRAELGREPMSDGEYEAVVRHIGFEPGTKKGKGVQWGDSPGGEI